MVWVVYPDEKVIDVWTPAGDDNMLVRTLGINDTLDGGAPLPGFTLPVKNVFPE